MPGVFTPGQPEDIYPTPFGDHPPAEWLLNVPAGRTTTSPPYIDGQGRVAIVAWEFDQCHNSSPHGDNCDCDDCATGCWIPPPSKTDNQAFHQGATIAAGPDGKHLEIPSGFLPVWDGHAMDEDIYAAMRHYNDPRRAGSRGRIMEMVQAAGGGWRPAAAGERPQVAWYLGAILPGVTNQRVERLRGGVLSGDWRWVPELGDVEPLGPVLVNRGGLPHGIKPEPAQNTNDEFFGILRRSGYDVVRDASGQIVQATSRIVVMANATYAPTKGTAMQLQIPTGMTPEQAQTLINAGAGHGAVQACAGGCTTNVGGDAPVSVTADAMAKTLTEAVGAAMAPLMEEMERERVRSRARQISV